MSSPLRSAFLQEIQERGFLYQATHLEELDAALCTGIQQAYIGFDATATSLHVGNLIQIMMLRRLQQAGHKPVVLMGGGTTRVGDPSGRDETRKILSDEDIDLNLRSIKRIFEKYLTFGEGPTDALMVNNADWLNSLNYLDFLRDYGPLFSINRMMSFDSVQSRLDREQPLSFLEFNYMILQAYDFLELHARHRVYLQMGGADQWGNIVSGVDLIRRKTHKPAFGLTSPLIATANGAKMGKTAQGAVWLNAENRSPFEFWQFWRNTQDSDVNRFLCLYTDLPLEEIHALTQQSGAALNEAKKVLADETTRLCHGDEAVHQARHQARALFEIKEQGDEDRLPVIELEAARLKLDLPLIALLQELGLVTSLGEARRLIRGQGVKINDTLVTDEQRILDLEDFNDSAMLKISVGKKKHRFIKLVQPNLFE